MKRAIATVLATFLTNSAALAKDYTVNFAIDMHGRQDTGSVECRFGELCVARMESLRMEFKVWISRPHLDSAHVFLDGDSGCCLFEGALSTLTVDPRARLRKHRLFVGQRADDDSLVYIQNEHVGDLYLKFQFH